MEIKLDDANGAFISLIKDNTQLITLDTNFFLLPDRYSNLNIPDITMDFWINYWLDPLFTCFPNLAIHEAVDKEIVDAQARCYVDKKLIAAPPALTILSDSQLTPNEILIRNAKEALIAPNTKYIPQLDNKDDRGEVKTLAYISTKHLLYFASHDDNALNLIKNSEKLKTSLDEQQAIHMYELLYYLVKKGNCTAKYVKAIYKIQYHLTRHEKSVNPEWGSFIQNMDAIYETFFK